MAPTLKNACDLIVNSVRDSSLHFCFKETPHSIYLTIRKKFLHSEYLSKEKLEDESVSLEMKLKVAEDVNWRLKLQCQEATQDWEKVHERNRALEDEVNA